MQFLEDRVKTVLPWRVEQAQEQYRARLIEGLSADNSAVRRKLLAHPSYGEQHLARLLENLKSTDLKEDRAIDALITGGPPEVAAAISRFAAACYHLVGTSVVNCETGLDVVALAEVRLADIAGEGLLSDTNVFLNCCFEVAMQAVNEIAFPMHVIDALPLETVAKARARLQDQGFQKAYDEVIRTFLSRMQRSSGIESINAWDPDHTVVLVKQLSDHFRAYFAEEVPGYRKAIQERRAGEAIRAGAETVKNIGGAVPGLGELISVVDVIKAGASAVGATTDAMSYRDHNAANAAARRERDEKIERALQELAPTNKAKILTALRQLRAICAELHRPL